MQNQAVSTGNRTTMLCVDSFQNGEIKGRIYNPYLDTGEEFDSLMHMLLKLDTVLDDMRFPQTYDSKRTFSPLSRPVAKPNSDQRPGQLATFAVKIMFRQNASWQGSASWLEGGEELSFRSALELLFLINSAMEEAVRKNAGK